MAPYGAVAMGEIDIVTQKLHARINEPHAWWSGRRSAEFFRRTGDAAAAEGNHATAGNYYLRAANYYYCGERMIEPGDKKLGMYNRICIAR